VQVLGRPEDGAGQTVRDHQMMADCDAVHRSPAFQS
jgi:hypothetical protein